MKKQLFILIAALISASAFAQLPNGSLAPNFVATDINGNSHELYQYLQQGYTVVIDVSATWCGPCWNYHTGNYNGTNGEGALHVLWEEHGVANGGNVIVLMVEGDGTTNTDCLYGSTGCNSSTQGDWVTGTPYPIIDDASIASAYQIAYYPTIYTICPNGIVTETSQITAADHWNFIQQASCQTVSANDAMLLSYTGTTNTCDVANLSIVVANIGQNPITSLNITASGVTPPVNYNWSGNLSSFQSASINLGTVNIIDGQSVVINITNSDDNPTNNTLSPNVSATVATNFIRLELQTDVYPGDYVLHIFNESNVEVATGGPWAPFDVQMDPMYIVEDFFLPGTGCYRVELQDMYGDGLYDGAYCKVYGMTSAWTPMGLILDVLPSQFEVVEGAAKVNQLVGVDELNSIDYVKFYPNPSQGLVQMQLGLSQNGIAALEVVNMLGEIVFSQVMGSVPAGVSSHQFDFTTLPAGIYVANLYMNGSKQTQRITLK